MYQTWLPETFVCLMKVKFQRMGLKHPWQVNQSSIYNPNTNTKCTSIKNELCNLRIRDGQVSVQKPKSGKNLCPSLIRLQYTSEAILERNTLMKRTFSDLLKSLQLTYGQFFRHLPVPWFKNFGITPRVKKNLDIKHVLGNNLVLGLWDPGPSENYRSKKLLWISMLFNHFLPFSFSTKHPSSVESCTLRLYNPVLMNSS